MTSIILFLYEKNKIINKLYNNFAEIYFTLCVIDKNLGNFLIKKEITDMNFRINYKLTMEIINTIKEFDFDEYTSFFDSKFNSLLEQFLSFNLKLYNLHNIVGERNQGVLYHELTLKDLELKRLQGIAEQMLLNKIKIIFYKLVWCYVYIPKISLSTIFTISSGKYSFLLDFCFGSVICCLTCGKFFKIFINEYISACGVLSALFLKLL